MAAFRALLLDGTGLDCECADACVNSLYVTTYTEEKDSHFVYVC